MLKRMLWCLLLLLSISARAGNIYFGPTVFIENTTSDNDNFRAIHPRISVGYEEIIHYIFLAGELYFVPGAISFSESNTYRPQSVQTQQQYGLSFLPGLYISEYIVGYARLGMVETRFWGPNVTKAGAEIGVGLQSQLSDNWSLRTEYIYYAYPSISTIGRPHTDQYGLGLIYRLQ